MLTNLTANPVQLDNAGEAQGSTIGGLVAAAQQQLEAFRCWEVRQGGCSAAMERAAELAVQALQVVSSSGTAARRDSAQQQEASAASPVPSECSICFEQLPAAAFFVIGKLGSLLKHQTCHESCAPPSPSLRVC